MMQTLLQNDSKDSESNFGLLDQPTPSTLTSYNLMNSNTIHNSSEQDTYDQYKCATYYPTTKKRVIRIKRVYSTRTRGRSGPLQSLARKLGRFKVRTVVVEVTPNQ
ncbi:hypothetical protein QL285_089211 [Trifolium repens]|jgi:hypothetical protein|nr:hypothetical protein QL285_089211 [Trifolium repens]